MYKLQANGEMSQEEAQSIQKHIILAKSIAKVKANQKHLKDKSSPKSYNKVKSKINQNLKTKNYRSPFRNPSPPKHTGMLSQSSISKSPSKGSKKTVKRPKTAKGKKDKNMLNESPYSQFIKDTESQILENAMSPQKLAKQSSHPVESYEVTTPTKTIDLRKDLQREFDNQERQQREERDNGRNKAMKEQAQDRYSKSYV
jgi:hypothetical protein